MPIYEYRCQECGHELEKLQRLSDAPLTDCPACEKPGLKRLISAAGFRLKGGGWYETDFKQGQKRNLVDGGEGKKEGAGEKKAEATAETRTASATESKPKADQAAKPTTPGAS